MEPNLSGHTLADVVPTMLAAIGTEGFTNRLGVADAEAACVLLVDGLGWELLNEYAELAPRLAGLAANGRPLTAGFPTTTVTSVASLGTGRRAGENGMVGIRFAIPGGPALDALKWRDLSTGEDLRDVVVPEEFQPEPTAFERAVAAGTQVTIASQGYHETTGMNRAVMRGGRFQPVYAFGDLTASVLAALSGPRPAFCHAYHGDLDRLGHLYGPGSPAWRYQLGQIDRMVSDIVAGLPAGAALAVVADHGMVLGDPADVVDADTEPGLQAGVRLVGGEARARYLYTEPGATADVVAAWRAALGSRAVVLTREDAIDRGWFGPVVADRVRPLIGDVIVAALGRTTVVRSKAVIPESNHVGYHGSVTSAELLVPFLVFRG
jgi:predicted AlkP superfamily pyrophosphatase or phosphodiesterase